MRLRRSTTIFFTVGALAAVAGAPARADNVPPATSPVAAEVTPQLSADVLPSPPAHPAPASAPTAAPDPAVPATAPPDTPVCTADVGIADGGDAPLCVTDDWSLGLADGGD